MTLEQAYFIAEIAAASAVVVSLLYLGMQLRSSRIQSKKEAVKMLTKQRGEFVKTLALDQEMAYIIPKGLAAKSRLPANEHYRFSSYFQYMFIEFELGFQTWKDGDINDQLWKGWDTAIRWWLKFPGVQKWWKLNHIGAYTKDFNLFVDGILKDQQSESNEKLIAYMEEVSSKGEEKSTIANEN